MTGVQTCALPIWLTQDEFKRRMMAYYTKLTELNEEAHGLEDKIAENMKELFQ